jgi:hypothetical protein
MWYLNFKNKKETPSRRYAKVTEKEKQRILNLMCIGKGCVYGVGWPLSLSILAIDYYLYDQDSDSSISEKFESHFIPCSKNCLFV